MRAPARVQDVDLTDPDLFVRGEQHEAFALLRREDPVHWQPQEWRPGFWNITRYEDLLRISADPHSFISGNGIVLDNDGRRTRREKELEAAGMYADPRGSMMIMTDPPRHTMLRKLVNKGFTPRAVARLEPYIRGVVTKIVDDLAGRDECDFVLDIARRLPLEVICELMGVPEGDWEAMFQLSNRIIGFDDPEFATESVEITPEDLQLSADLYQYLSGLCEERRREPREDLLTTLVHAEVDGHSLNENEIFVFFILLIVAGNETTRNSTSGGMLALIQNPSERQRLLDDPSLVPIAIEEIVRWTSPVTHFTRTVTRDVEIRGKTLREGQEICMWYPSANRDEDVFPHADRFDVGRSPNEHVAFGKGEHFCLGANLARLELRVMFEELLRRLPDVELAGEPVRLRSNFIGGIKRMPVRFSPIRS